MKRLFIVALCCCFAVALCWPHCRAADEQQSKLAKKIMDEKLKNTHKLIDGIALADFNKITSSVEELMRLSKTAEWLVYNTPKYEMYNNEFQRAGDAIIAKSKLKNIDGVTLAYFELTMSCVRCHSYVREIRGGLTLELSDVGP